ncbi:MAG: hypothetical protein FIA92_06070 [Chloroflexi bacterium]|nr:hypothetical protein [Chloroflexota bacterium]
MPIRNDHDAHDAALIAAHAAGDLTGAGLILANRLLATCDDCAALHADLRAIAASTRALQPMPVLAAAPRDFRLTPEQASRLRRGNLVRRLLRPFAAASSAVQPLAAAFSGLGAVGLAIVLLVPAFATPAGAPAEERNTLSAADSRATLAPAPVPGRAAAGPTAGSVDDYATAAPNPRAAPNPTAAPDASAALAPAEQATGQPGEKDDGADEENAPRSAPGAASGGPTTTTLVLVGSTALLGIGLALFLLRALARRVV